MELWNNSGCPQRQAGLLPSVARKHPKWRKTYEEVDHVIGRGGIAVLLGDRGTGKTQLAVEQIRYRAAQCMQHCKYLRASQLFIDLRKAYKNNHLTEDEAIAKYVRPHLLVIDEAQDRRHNEYEYTHLNLLIDLRYGDEKPTIMVANATEASFREQVGEDIWDRIAETGAIWVCNWPSFRVNGQRHGKTTTGTVPANSGHAE
jgi:DNA replication protein DnaC